MRHMKAPLRVTVDDGDTPLAARRHALPEIDWLTAADDIEAIARLKAERNAIVLAHNYMTPDIYHGVADITGDSLGLARQAAETDADVIVFAGVHFMAETAKITCPDKTVLIPDPEAGCSLAESITGADVRLLRERYPGVPVVAYVNTSAEVKAEVDICCTSGNAVEVVESLGADRVIFLPDQYLGRWVAGQTGVEHHPVGGLVHGARALHRGRAAPLPGRDAGRADHRPSRVPARRAGRGRLRRLHRRHDRLRRTAGGPSGW